MDFKNVKFENGAMSHVATVITNKINAGYREKEVLRNLVSVTRNNDVPETYLIYIFTAKNGDTFEAGRVANGNYNITG